VKICITLIIFGAALILFGIAYFLYSGGDSTELLLDKSAVAWDGERHEDYIANTSSSIAIPGWEYIDLKADSIKQSVNFRNPHTNSCLFAMTLFIENEEVWNSGYIKPGYGFYDIELSKTFPAGERDGKLFIKCYDVDGSELNSASINFKITFR